jgi:tetratricopeptide (TPR) repeat protein
MKKLSELYQAILNKPLYAAILIGIVCFSVHGVTLLNDYNLDDNLVTQNHRLTSKGISAIPEIYRSPYYQDDMGYSYGYRPTTLASFAIEKSLFGESALVSHTVNLALYLATCLLIFFLIKRIFPDKVDMALFAALLFTVHPIHTEVVASIKNRDEILSLLFALAGCFVLIRPNRWWINVLSASALFFLSVSSKMSAVNVILLLALIPAYPRPFFKDFMLLALYAISLNFVFEGRDAIYDTSTRNISVIISLFFIVRLASSSVIHLVASWSTIYITKVTTSLTAIITHAQSGWSKIRKKTFVVNQYSTHEKLGIAIGSFITYWLMYDYLETPQDNLLLITVIGSFLFLRTDNPGIFLRLSIIMLVLEANLEFQVFLLLSIAIAVYENALRKYVLQSLILIALGTILQFYWFGGLYIIKYVFYALCLLSPPYSKPVRLKWALFALSCLCLTLITGLPIFEEQVEEIELMDVWGYYMFLLMITKVMIRVESENIGSKSLFNRFKNMITKVVIRIESKSRMSICFLDSLKTRVPRISNILFGTLYVFLSIYAVNTFLRDMTYELITESHKKVNNSLVHIQSESIEWFYGSESEPKDAKPWTANHEQSWQRPFDFIEHPLSPFAAPNDKYGTTAITLNKYLGRLFVPYPLAFYYGYDEIKMDTFFSHWSLFSIVIHLIILFIAFHYRKTHSILSIGIILYLTSIILFSGAVEIVAGMFADRFSYTASFGFCLAIAVGLKLLANTLNQTARVSFTTLGIVLLLSFSAYSFQRNKLWKNKLVLMRHDINVVPNSAQAHSLLAHALMENVFSDGQLSETEKTGKASEAVRHFERATEIYPHFFNAWVDLGRVNIEINQPEKAISAFEKALAEDSTYTPILADLAVLNEQLGRKEQTIFYYREYIEDGSAPIEVYDDLARIFYELERYQESIVVCKQYLMIDPSNEDFQRNISMMQEFLDTTSSEKTNLIQ